MCRGLRRSVCHFALPTGEPLEITIPEGTANGQTIRLRGKGGEGFGGGPRGDTLVTLHVRPHKLFRRDGDDIHITLPITLDEAVLGGQVPTNDQKAMLKIHLKLQMTRYRKLCWCLRISDFARRLELVRLFRLAANRVTQTLRALSVPTCRSSRRSHPRKDD
jgi:DnaJ-like protein